MLAATAFIGCSLVSFLYTYPKLRKNIIAIRNNATPTIIQKGEDILYAAERIQLMTYDVSKIRKIYEDIIKDFNFTNSEIDEILKAGDSEIDKANLVEKMVALYRKHQLGTFEDSIDNALYYVIDKIFKLGSDHDNDFKDYLCGCEEAQDYSKQVPKELKPAFVQFKDAYKTLAIHKKEAIINESRAFQAKTSALMLASAAICYYGPLTSALSNQEYAKIGCVVLAASTSLVFNCYAMKFILDNNPIYSMKHRCNTKLCAERVTPHPEYVLIVIASTAAPVAAGHYVAGLM